MAAAVQAGFRMARQTRKPVAEEPVPITGLAEAPMHILPLEPMAAMAVAVVQSMEPAVGVATRVAVAEEMEAPMVRVAAEALTAEPTK